MLVSNTPGALRASRYQIDYACPPTLGAPVGGRVPEKAQKTHVCFMFLGLFGDRDLFHRIGHQSPGLHGRIITFGAGSGGSLEKDFCFLFEKRLFLFEKHDFGEIWEDMGRPDIDYQW